VAHAAVLLLAAIGWVTRGRRSYRIPAYGTEREREELGRDLV
jgi:hypothetical protein